MSSYLHYLPGELIGIVTGYNLDSEAGNLFNLIDSYPDLKEIIVENFLMINVNELYKTLIEISVNFNMKISEMFLLVLKYILARYDFPHDLNFVERYYMIVRELDLENFKEGLDNDDTTEELYNIIIHLLFHYRYPSIIRYFYKNEEDFDNVSLEDLYESLELLRFEEYHLLNPNSLDEDMIIDILKLWEKDTENKISDILMPLDNFKELIDSDRYKNLVHFLVENNIDVRV